MKKLKTAVTGLGRIGWQFHLPAIHKNANFELTAVHDPLEERLQEAKETYGAKGYRDFYQMIDAENPDLAVIASPTHVHKDQTIYAMERGCDIFLEKPMARDISEAKEIVNARERTGRKLMLYQPQRASAVTQSLKRLIDSGIIGDVFMIKVANISYVFRNDWQAFKKYGGGMLNNYGAHEIDRALYLSGSYAKKISASMARIASLGDADDVVKILMETENGIALDIEINMASAIDIPEAIVHGKLGAIVLQYDDMSAFWHVRYFDPKDREGIPVSDDLAATGRRYMDTGMRPKAWLEEKHVIKDSDALVYYDECYKYFALGKEPFVPVEDTLEVMRIMDECRRYSGWSQDE